MCLGVMHVSDITRVFCRCLNLSPQVIRAGSRSGGLSNELQLCQDKDTDFVASAAESLSTAFDRFDGLMAQAGLMTRAISYLTRTC